MKKNETFEKCLASVNPKVKEEVSKNVDLANLLDDERKKGNIVIQTIGGLEIANLETFCSQEGLLYDLNRDMATCKHQIRQNTMGWINNYACALVIEYLKARIEELEKGVI